jgi:hypothetical protein
VLRTVLLALLALGLAVGAVACGGSSQSKSSGQAGPIDLVSAVVQKIGDLKTVHISMTGSESIPGAQKPMTFDAQGAVDYAARRSTMTMSMDISGMRTLPGGLGSLSELEMEMVTDGLVAYMRMPFLGQLGVSDKPWIKMDLASIGKQAGFDVSSLMGSGQGNPLQTLDYLRGLENVEKLGHETVRGVETTHYRGTFNLDKYVAGLPESQRKAMQELLDKTGSVGVPENMPMELWVDDQGLLRRLSYALETSVGTSAGKVAMKVALELFDYGKPVTITIPPADQVADFAELTAGVGTAS